MKENRNIIEKARNIQRRIDAKRTNLPILSLKTYWQFLFTVFFICGFMLTVYCFLYGIHPMAVGANGSPFLFFGLGFICMLGYIYEKANTIK